MPKNNSRMGRPPVETPRNVRFTIGLCREDANYLDEMSARMGLNRGSLIVFIVETLVASEFSLLGFMKAGLKIQKRYKEAGNEFEMPTLGADAKRPHPRFPSDTELDASDLEGGIEQIKSDFETTETQQ